MGTGLHMAPGDIAFKSNFASMNAATGVVEKRRADRYFEAEGPVLCQALDGALRLGAVLCCAPCAALPALLLAPLPACACDGCDGLRSQELYRAIQAAQPAARCGRRMCALVL